MNPSDVLIPETTQEKAQALLAAAARLGYDADVVKVTRDGFIVPQDVAEAALPPTRRRNRNRNRSTKEK